MNCRYCHAVVSAKPWTIEQQRLNSHTPPYLLALKLRLFVRRKPFDARRELCGMSAAGLSLRTIGLGRRPGQVICLVDVMSVNQVVFKHFGFS